MTSDVLGAYLDPSRVKDARKKFDDLVLDPPVRSHKPKKSNRKKGTGSMLAREKWQITTIKVLEMVFEERCRQIKKHAEAMRALPDGTGPDVEWLGPKFSEYEPASARDIQIAFREEYEGLRGAENPDGECGQLTRMHLVREELAEAFELDGDDPEFVSEILQVAALCVQWAEYKVEAQEAQALI